MESAVRHVDGPFHKSLITKINVVKELLEGKTRLRGGRQVLDACRYLQVLEG